MVLNLLVLCFVFVYYLSVEALGNAPGLALSEVESLTKRRSHSSSLLPENVKSTVHLNGYQEVDDDHSSLMPGMQRELDDVLALDAPAPGRKRQMIGELLKVVPDNNMEATSFFGNAVTLSAGGRYALIGAYWKDEGSVLNAGAAFVFFKNDNEQWILQQKLFASDLERDARFGDSVALSSDGSLALVGAPKKDEGGLDDVGAAYAFRRDGEQWTQVQKLVASSSEQSEGTLFGKSVALSTDGSWAIIGAYFTDGSLNNAGAVFTFSLSNQQWSVQQKLVASDPEENAGFGFDIALSADLSILLVSAPFKDEGGVEDAGAAYAFAFQNGSDQRWIQEEKFVAHDVLVDAAWFGFSLSVSANGSVALISAHWQDEGGLNSAGVAYTYTRSDRDQQWAQEEKLVPSDLEEAAWFGYSLSLSADASAALIGASRKDESVNEAGAAYFFTRSSERGWAEQQKLVIDELTTSANFGNSVSLSRDGLTMIIGANLKDEGGLSNAGAAYIGSLSGPTPPSSPSPPSSEGPSTTAAPASTSGHHSPASAPISPSNLSTDSMNPSSPLIDNSLSSSSLIDSTSLSSNSSQRLVETSSAESQAVLPSVILLRDPSTSPQSGSETIILIFAIVAGIILGLIILILVVFVQRGKRAKGASVLSDLSTVQSQSITGVASDNRSRSGSRSSHRSSGTSSLARSRSGSRGASRTQSRRSEMRRSYHQKINISADSGQYGRSPGMVGVYNEAFPAGSTDLGYGKSPGGVGVYSETAEIGNEYGKSPGGVGVYSETNEIVSSEYGRSPGGVGIYSETKSEYNTYSELELKK